MTSKMTGALVSDKKDLVVSLEQKIAALEDKYSALEKKYSSLHERAYIGTMTDTTTGQTAEITVSQSKLIVGDAKQDKSRANILISRVDYRTGERKDHPLEEVDANPKPKIDERHAFTLKRIIRTPEPSFGEIDITSKALWNLLKNLLGNSPGHYFNGSPITLRSPFEHIIFNWETLQDAANQEKRGFDSESLVRARMDLKLLLDTVATGSGDLKLDKYFATRSANIKQRVITHDTLWTIFPPGALVYGHSFKSEHQLFVVESNVTAWPWATPKGGNLWCVNCWTYDWNGVAFKRSSVQIFIDNFEGQKQITSLPYYPFEYHDDREGIEKCLLERGKKFRAVCNAKKAFRMFEYSGQAVFEQRGFSGVNSDSEKVDSRVMVDFESYFNYGPSSVRMGSLRPMNSVECKCQDCRQNEALLKLFRSSFDDEQAQIGVWDDEQCMLCPPRVLGYVLRDKQWAQLRVMDLKEILKPDNQDAWSTRLKLADGKEETTKKLIFDLVDDIVEKKGKGLVMLLYGPPGVGKTTTAETVVIAARKPLFSISVADVGNEAKKVEKNLAKIFALATTWQAILLIDEADVFLETRTQGVNSNIERNSLVSVFLRVLEYYQGILMLTTNQIAQFDVAVKSRIHVAIKYDDLNDQQSFAIFNGFLKPLSEKGLIKDMSGILQWLEEDVCRSDVGLGGRQIRNIVTTAVGLARAAGNGQLEKKDLKKMLGNVKSFKAEFIRAFEKYKTSQKDL
ncbi:hypothetical protein EAF04_004874 [Stromatinia cepivora]|nr:hypothetical protein EAF04_004874 [Stromatinia cepivora]